MRHAEHPAERDARPTDDPDRFLLQDAGQSTDVFTSGPLVIETGALAVPSLQITQLAKLARGPLSPCNAVDYAEPFGELNFFDVSAFLSAFMDESGEADLNFDGLFNFFDVSVFLQLYAQGCPNADDPG